MYAFNDYKFTNNKSERSNCWDGLDVKVLIVIRKENNEYKKKNLKTPRGEHQKPKNDRQHNDQMKKDKRTNNELQNTTHKTKDRTTRTLLKTGVNSDAPEG